jgi:uncharacterized integral membrane protein
MAYCERCGEKNVDGADVCVKCSSALKPVSTTSAGSDPVTIGSWIITYLLMCIPLINLILLFVWAFDSNTQPSKKNWAKASLIWMAIGIGIAILFSIVFGAVIAGLLSQFR